MTHDLDAREVEKIADGLTAAQREAVVRAKSWCLAYELSVANDGRAGAHAAKSSGLFDCRYSSRLAGMKTYHLTDLGLIVRQHLQDRRS